MKRDSILHANGELIHIFVGYYRSENMRTTFRMMGLADYITLCNGLLGTTSIFMIILAVEGFSQPYQEGLRAEYVWAAVLCIQLSAIGDIIDGPVARKYSKRQLLGGSLDIMSDSLSFTVAPALLIFAMYGRMGEATPLWTVLLAIVCAWTIAAGMLRLARFDYEGASKDSWFTGLSTPGSAMLVLSAAMLIWVQPATGIGPYLSTWGENCNLCFGKGAEKPYFDWLVFPIMVLSGVWMISDRRLSKLKHGWPTALSIIQQLALLVATLYMLIFISNGGEANSEGANKFAASLLATSLGLTLFYVLAGPSIVKSELASKQFEQE